MRLSDRDRKDVIAALHDAIDWQDVVIDDWPNQNTMERRQYRRRLEKLIKKLTNRKRNHPNKTQGATNVN